MFDSTTYILGMFSAVVACVLGFPFCTPTSSSSAAASGSSAPTWVLGMTPGHVSRIVLYETVLVGLLSLAVGLSLIHI